MLEDADQTIVCVSCLTQNYPDTTFCRKCGAPISTTATLDPIKQIQAQGHLFRTALEGRPRFIAVLGMWIMFFPLLVGSAYGAIYLITHRREFADFVFFWVAAGLAYLSFVVLYRITKNYLTIPRRQDDE